MSDDRDPVRTVAELAKDIRIAMVTTHDGQGRLVSRPMAQQEVEFDGDLWFFAERDSSAVTEVGADPRVNVALSSATTWISLSGTAEVVEDRAKAKELWNAWVGAWLPQGPDDPSVVLLRFRAESAEYWDTPGGRVASALSFVKAKVTGRRYEGGENETVRL
ncbi:MAG TPA: pyridoxamine 5'-phosphate oxidase family protein [Pseudonocardiaceae bacterium]